MRRSKRPASRNTMAAAVANETEKITRSMHLHRILPADPDTRRPTHCTSRRVISAHGYIVYDSAAARMALDAGHPGGAWRPAAFRGRRPGGPHPPPEHRPDPH